MWQVSTNHIGELGKHAQAVFRNFEERKDFLFQMYEANFMVGDVYETYALVIFGKLITFVLNTEIQKQMDATEKASSHGLAAICNDLRDATRNLTISGALYSIFVTT